MPFCTCRGLAGIRAGCRVCSDHTSGLNPEAKPCQAEQKTPAFLRMQQEAEAKEAEEEAEKKRRWEDEVASKRFWVRSLPPVRLAIVTWCYGMPPGDSGSDCHVLQQSHGAVL